MEICCACWILQRVPSFAYFILYFSILRGFCACLFASLNFPWIREKIRLSLTDALSIWILPRVLNAIDGDKKEPVGVARFRRAEEKGRERSSGERQTRRKRENGPFHRQNGREAWRVSVSFREDAAPSTRLDSCRPFVCRSSPSRDKWERGSDCYGGVARFESCFSFGLQYWYGFCWIFHRFDRSSAFLSLFFHLLSW